MDLDPKVPYLGEDDEGNLIEPSDEQMQDLYRQIGKPDTRDDVGEDGFVSAYHGSLIFTPTFWNVDTSSAIYKTYSVRKLSDP